MNILQWLKENGYEYIWDVEIGRKTPDIIGFNDKEIIAFEIKQTAAEVTAAMKQCLQYLKKVNKVYVILPSKAVDELSKSSFQSLQKNRIGLIRANEKIKVLLNAKSFGQLNKEFLEKLKERSLNKAVKENNFEEKIKELLFKHPEGLTAVDISENLGMHRHTATKYVQQLVSSGVIVQRRVGPARLCYLKETLGKKESKKDMKVFL